VRLGDSIRLGSDLTIPINKAGAMIVDWKQPVDRAGFDDFELAADQIENKHTPVIDPARLKDRLILLARTDTPSRTLTLPTGGKGSPGELFAEAIATAEANAFARPAGWWGVAAVLMTGLALAWVVRGRTLPWMGALALGFTAGYLLICIAVFEAGRVELPLTPMMGLALFITIYRILAGCEPKH
jgi:hypothetical protein